MTLAVKKIREDFTILNQIRNGKPIIYADSACMALKPRQVVDCLIDYYTKFTACAGRSPHFFSRETTKRYEEARESLASFINAKDPSEIAWTKNTTEALNLGADCLKLDGTETIITSSESHNSNIVKWIRLKDHNKVKLEIMETRIDGFFDMENFADTVSRCEEGKFLASFAHVSNVTGARLDIKEIGKIVHEREGILQVDAAQSFPHMPIDVQELDIDLMGVSMHKACGPTGMGFLYGKYDILKDLEPLILGGETISDVHIHPDEITLLPPPFRFEAGLQNYAGAIASGAAVEYLSSIGMENITAHEELLSETMLKGLADLGDRISVLGPEDPKKRAGLAAIDLKDINPHDVAILLDEMANIMLRAGYHCTHAYHHSLHLEEGTLRPSWYLYNTVDEVKVFIETLTEIVDSMS
ncbi:MAG: aminotransferase class V-fold PLP-dependent enzyme [Candidatus Odinarchaeota archaeon]